MTRSQDDQTRSRTTTRTKLVLGVFVTSMTAVTGMLLMSGGFEMPTTRFTATKPVIMAPAESLGAGDATPVPSAALGVDEGRWQHIVIHDSGSMAGTVRELDVQARRAGLDDLGYHFVIGNGAGLSDGVVEATPRWNRQGAGAHVAASPAPSPAERARIDDLNRRSIGICLIGNGERKAFTESQIRALIDLVRSLQVQLDIPASGVMLHSDLNREVASPGRFFPIERLEARLEP
ncbi:MAG: peptidoglycan recognition family protein [Planctomycetota bacterium]|nr:peptidoglycan recognition family protein [Planctomycetota bacterium]